MKVDGEWIECHRCNGIGWVEGGKCLECNGDGEWYEYYDDPVPDFDEKGEEVKP